jgi:pimeloyl-ACP methyl ester carboxylesterase
VTARRRRAIAALLAVTVSVGGITACSDDGAADATSASADTDATTAPAEAGDAAAGGSVADGDEPARLVAEELTDPGADFYAVPDPLPGSAPGELIRYQRVEPSIVDGATTWRIMVRSESLAGDPIAVTGVALVPDAPAPDGGRPLLTLAHGTTGLADECTPSKDPGSELLLMGQAVADGWLVAMTDYEGLGTPGRHPYLVGGSEGRSVLDTIVGAGSLPGADPSERLAIAGYSQGGHGALWANELAAEWTPQLEVVGTFAGAPATEIDVILAAAPSLPVAGFAYMIIAGFAAAYPEADPALILTPEGLDRLDVVDEVCGRDVIAEFAGTAPGDLVRADGPGSDPWARLATENNPGQVRTEAPVLIIHSEKDEVVPATLSAILHDRMCANGQVVERRVLAEGGHVDAAPGAYASGLAWLADRFAGSGTPASTCAAG